MIKAPAKALDRFLSGKRWVIRDFGGSLVDIHQWEFQDPKMDVLYHIKPYLGVYPLT